MICGSRIQRTKGERKLRVQWNLSEIKGSAIRAAEFAGDFVLSGIGVDREDELEDEAPFIVVFPVLDLEPNS
jgi:hypothetical protein